MAMGDIGKVITTEADGNTRVELHDSDDSIAEHFGDPGDDSLPLPGDAAALVDGPGTGTHHATGYHDPNNPGQAQPGEKRIYSRNAAGVAVAEIWLKGDGSVSIKSLIAPAGGTIELDPATGAVTINGDCEVDPTGEVIARKSVGGGVKLSTHMTPSPFGPLGPPVPGT